MERFSTRIEYFEGYINSWREALTCLHPTCITGALPFALISEATIATSRRRISSVLPPPVCIPPHSSPCFCSLLEFEFAREKGNELRKPSNLFFSLILSFLRDLLMDLCHRNSKTSTPLHTTSSGTDVS